MKYVKQIFLSNTSYLKFFMKYFKEFLYSKNHFFSWNIIALGQKKINTKVRINF